MHADSRQLISLRDGEPTDAVVADHVRGCDSCHRELVQYRRLKAALSGLPEMPPPADSWSLIAERRALERTPREPRLSNARHAMVAASLVAALTAGVLLHESRQPEPPVSSAGDTVADLQQRSRELEFVLQRYRTPAVMSLHTAGAISELEDGIALIDYRLNAGDTAKQEYDLWQQRVALMETLVTVRAAESWIDGI